MKLHTNRVSLIIVSLLLFSSCTIKEKKQSPKVPYEVEDIKLPKGLTPEIGGLDFLPDGRLVACFLRGKVMVYDPKSKKWSLFAEGLHLPLGILAVSSTEILVM